MPSLSTPEEVAAYMSAATSKSDWNERCDAVKSANNGYPDFWYATIVLSGLMATTSRNFSS